MQGRLRFLLIVAFLLVIGALIVVFVILPGTNNDTVEPGATQVTQNTTSEPATQSPPTQPPVVFVDIVVAVQNLSRGAVIPPNAVALFPWPEQSLPVNALTSLEDVIGKRARTDIVQQQPILQSMVIPDLSQLADVGSDLAASIPTGLVAVAVPVDRLTSVAYGIQRGDRVDVIISALFVDIDEEFQSALPNLISFTTINPETGAIEILTGIEGRTESVSLVTADGARPYAVVVGPSEQARPRLATQRTIQDALVMGIGNFPADGVLYGLDPTSTPVGLDSQPTPIPANQSNATLAPTLAPPRPDIVTLAVTPQDAVVLTYLIEAKIPITFALRSASDTGQSPTVSVTLDYVLTTYGIQVPDKLEYSLEPAIRSIRQLVTDQQISLSSAAP